ncbi:lysin B [Gordonia phage VanLee]|uniref:Lysin B n=1 Tax=Gordonia phage VanLee TaxID=2845816 RepID=A0A8F2IF88_9CAUD|nr:lysin B [Gordonia phage VanLee]QWS68221.1 lysin B [Gordonia phage VanLee]
MPKIIQVRGIGEPRDRNLLSLMSTQVPNAHVVELPWSAEYGPVPQLLGQAFMTATAEVPAMLRAELDKGPAFVTAFSGGCVGAGPVIVEGHPNLLGAVFVADPMNPDDGSGMFGVAGSRSLPAGVRKLAHPRDMICRCERNSPIRTFSDQTAAASLADPFLWAGDIADRIRRNRWQKIVVPWHNPIATYGLYDRAAKAIHGYLPPPVGLGIHTRYNVDRENNGLTFLANGARWIDRQARLKVRT